MAKKGAKKPEKIFLDTARTNGERKTVSGRYIKVVQASSAAAEIQIATDRNLPEEYETLNINGYIYQDQPFSEIFIKNTAQAGEWVRLIISEGPKDYDVGNPATLTVNGITDAVKVKADPATNGGNLAVADATAQAKLDTVITDLGTIATDIGDLKTAFQTYGNNGVKQGLTDLTGATYASQSSAGTNNVVTGAANTNGIIVHLGEVTADENVATAAIKAGGNVLAATGGTAGGSSYSAQGLAQLRDIKIPAGQALDLVVQIGTGGAAQAFVWYTKL